MTQFNTINKLNLTLNTDVKINIINQEQATIEALQESQNYTGKCDVFFGLKTHIEDLIPNIKDLEIVNKHQNTILDELKSKNPDLKTELVKVDLVTETSAIIIPKNINTHMGSVEINFQILPHPHNNNTWYINKTNNQETEALHEHDIPAGTTEIKQIGFDKDGKAHQMPTSIQIVPNIINKKITSLQQLFHDAESFNQDLSSWDVSNITNMRGTFTFAKNFNGNITSWNTSNVTDMGFMFGSAYNFNQNVNTKLITTSQDKTYKAWDVSNVENMEHMFQSLKYFDKPLNNWDVFKVKNMSHMFEGTGFFNQNLSNWIVVNVIDMSRMFNNAYSFNNSVNKPGEFDKPLTWNTSNAENMEAMFYNSKNFSQNLSDWNVNKVTNYKNFGNSSNNFPKTKWPYKFRN